jgi:beta-barrel assembly-enhancing protease
MRVPILSIASALAAQAAGVNLYSVEKEIALGRQLAAEVERQAAMLDDPIVAEYVNRVGQNLAKQSGAPVTWTFKVIRSNELNAFALPGGFVFVNTGLIKMCDDEAELASALAHEVAHVAARHMTRQATRSQFARLGTVPLTVLLGGRAGAAVRQASALGIPLTFLHFARADESEADSMGIRYLDAAGYDPSCAITLFEKLDSLDRRNPGAVSRIFLTHPPNGARLQKLQREIGDALTARPQYLVTTSEYAEIRGRLFR